MSASVKDMFGLDFVARPMMFRIGAGAKRSATGFLSINCPLCVSRGQRRADRKRRCGINVSSDHIGINCFNCGLRTRYRPGETLSRDMQDFLRGVGIPDTEVKRMALHAQRLKHMAGSSPLPTPTGATFAGPSFTERALPAGARPLTALADEGRTDDDFLAVAAYLISRGDAVVQATDYHWSPDTAHGMNRRLIIPFRFENKIVGWTARTIDHGVVERYHSSMPSDFLFNTRVLSIPSRRWVILVEGVFDALAIDGVGLLGAKMNARQAAWIDGCDKKKVVVPDRDAAGQRLIDVALANDWYVAFPRLRDGFGHDNWWDAEVKDAAEAAGRYGRLYALRSIIATATNNKARINQLRKVLF